jgi:hypothetical protein
MLDSGFMPLVIWGVTETSKVVDVLLPLGRKQYSCVQGYLHCLHYALCLMQLSIVCNLESGLLVIDAVGLRSMYFVVMPRVNVGGMTPGRVKRLERCKDYG